MRINAKERRSDLLGGKLSPKLTTLLATCFAFRRKLEEMFDSLSEDEVEVNEEVDAGVGVGKRKREHSTVPGKMEVFLRIRPTPEEALPECIHATGSNSIAISAPEGHMGTRNAEKSRIFAFSKVYEADTTNKELFSKQFSKRVNNALYPACESLAVFAYGITATGKTHSMEGNSADPGIIPQTLQLLFHNKSSDEEVSISMYEIYNECVYDMLGYASKGSNAGKPTSLKLKEDGSGQIWIPGLSRSVVETSEQAKDALALGLSYRKHAPTGMNKRSSRSHAVVLINIADAGTGEWRSSVSFVDLAGSERAQRTGNEGLRLRESVAINSSLMTLGRCLEALRWNHDNAKAKRKKHVPFRQAKITHAFKNAFLGSGSTVLLVNVSASAKDYEETVHVLKYASLATALPCSSQPTRAVVNIEPAAKRQREAGTGAGAAAVAAGEEMEYVSPGGEGDAELLAEENEELIEEVERLKRELFESERRAAEMEARIREEVADEMSELLREMEGSYHARLEAEVGAAKSAAPGATDSSKAEAEDLRRALSAAEAELSEAKAEIGAIQRANEENEHALVDSFKSLLEEETTQLKANAAMEKETLELQLERQRQENEGLTVRLRRMKEATVATLRRYQANLSPSRPVGSPLALTKLLEDSEKELVSSVEMVQGQPEPGPLHHPSLAEDFCDLAAEPEEAKENQPVAKKRGKKARRQRKPIGEAKVAQPTPVARRTRAGRRACAAIENVN